LRFLVQRAFKGSNELFWESNELFWDLLESSGSPSFDKNEMVHINLWRHSECPHIPGGGRNIPFRSIPYVPQFFVSCLFTLFPFNVSTNVMKCTKQEYGTPHQNICSPQHNIPLH